MALEAGCDEVDARLSVHQLDEIMMADLTVKDSTGRKCTFHEKEAREHEGCHLGGGSFGEVYKAVHKVHGDVAVKLAKPGKEDQVVLMYQKEAGKHVLSLTSNHIVSIKGFVQCEKAACDCGGLIGIVMEYMKHGSLWDFRISKWQDRPDLWPLTNRMVHQISSGMHFLHSKDIIHRDLKLENVLVDGNLNVKVADLGLATNLQTSFGDERCGTNSHKPPEAFRTDLPNSTKVVTPEYDVYSFAMTLYELLTGIHPYSDRGFYMMMLLKVDSKQSPCLQPVPANTPEDLIRVMEESWSYEPNDRPNFREITEWVANLDTEPTHESLGHYLGEQRSPENVGRADDEPVRRGMQDLPVNDPNPVEQSNGNAAIPITETVTQNQVEGHESPPTHPIIQRSSSKKEGKKDDKSVGRGMKNLTEQHQATARHQSNTIAAVHDTRPVIDNESVRMQGLTLNDPTLAKQSNGNTAIPITETVTQNQVEGQESHPTHLGQDNVVRQPEIQHSQPSSQEPSKPSSFGQLKSQQSGPENGCHADIFQPTVEAEQSMEFKGIGPTESSPGPSASQPLKSYREDGKPVPVESLDGNTEYAVGHTAGGPIHQESPLVAPSQPSSTERDPTIIFDSSQPSDEDFEIKVKVRLNIQPRASMASKLDQIFICLERCKHRDYWDSNSSLSTMFSFSDITLKSLQLPATVDEDDFTLYLCVCNKRDLDKLHKLSEKGHLRQSLYGFFVDVHLKEVCRPCEPDLKVESWEEQFNKGTAHFQKKEKANESKKSDSENSESRQKQPNENRSGASFTQTNCSGATQINTGKVSITLNSAPKNMVIGDQYNYYNHYRGSKGAGEGAGGHSYGRQPQKKKQGETKLCDKYHCEGIFDHNGGELQIPSYGFTLSIPPGALPEGTSETISLDVIKDIPPEITLRHDETLLTYGFQCLPSGLQFVSDKPVTLKIPHCANLIDPTKVQVVLYFWNHEGEADRIVQTSRTCLVTCNHVEILLEHFTIVFPAFITNLFYMKSKRMSFMPFLPKIMPQCREMPLEFRMANKPHGNSWRDVHDIREQAEYQPAKDDDDEMNVKYEAMEITCQLNDNDTCRKIVDASFIENSKHTVYFKLDFIGKADDLLVNLEVIQSKLPMEIMFKTNFLASPTAKTSLGNTVSVSPLSLVSTSVAIPPQDATAVADEVSTSQTSDAVSDGQLNILAAHIPHEKYNDLSVGLGIEYNEASRILKQHGSDYKPAMRECLSVWKNKSGGSFTELKSICNNFHLEGLWRKYMK